jgi:hypothetical protein
MSKRWASSLDRAQREVLPLNLSLYHAARDYPGGIKAVAAVHGLNPTTLQHKLSPTHETHRTNIDEFEAVLATTQDERILDSIGETMGNCIWVRAVERRKQSRFHDELDVLKSVSRLHDRLGEMIATVRSSLENGGGNGDERAELRLRTRRLLEAVLVLELAAQGSEDERDG